MQGCAQHLSEVCGMCSHASSIILRLANSLDPCKSCNLCACCSNSSPLHLPQHSSANTVSKSSMPHAAPALHPDKVHHNEQFVSNDDRQRPSRTSRRQVRQGKVRCGQAAWTASEEAEPTPSSQYRLSSSPDSTADAAHCNNCCAYLLKKASSSMRLKSAR